MISRRVAGYVDGISRPWILRIGLAVTILVLLSPAVLSAVTFDPDAATDLQRGTVTSAANGSTVIGIQGFHFRGHGSTKKPARLVSVDDRARTEWVVNGSEGGAVWFYDVDPLPIDNLLVVSTEPGRTVIHELDPRTMKRQWEEDLPFADTHDADWMSEDELAIANMRNWDEANGTSNDRIVIYDRSRGEITWEWRFNDHYPADMDGGHNEDWTHVNDVDVIDEHRLLVSPRNFDQVIVLNRTTNEIELQLGEDGDHTVLREQHNPDFLESETGRPTILVADSENDRVVEYELVGDCRHPAEGPPGNAVDCDWELVWEVGGATLNWPRDADRLPNGNTLITDTLNHRVIEVTPTGEIVWEYYATWGPYDAERVGTGSGSNGPTMRDLDVTGSYELTGSAGLTPGAGEDLTFADWIRAETAGTVIEEPASEFAQRWAHVTPWFRPVWLSDWDFALAVLGGLLAVGWLSVDLVLHRRQVVRWARRAVRLP